jgi:hypothetical protein
MLSIGGGAMAEERQRWISATAFIGFTILWAIICYWAWQNFGDQHPWIVLGVAGAVYLVLLSQLSVGLGLEEGFGKAFGVALPLAIFGWVAWDLYPGELLSKPLASVTVGELLGLLFSLAFLGAVGMICIRALQDD